MRRGLLTEELGEVEFKVLELCFEFRHGRCVVVEVEEFRGFREREV